MERAVGKNEKLESFKLESLKLKRAKRSWKEPSEVGKNRLKLERTERSWKASFEVRKFRWSWKVSPRLESSGWCWKVWMKMESCDWSWKVHHKFQIRVRETYKLGTISAKPLNFIKQNFYHPKKLLNLTWNLWRTFQLQSKLSKFKRSFPTSIGSFQLRSVLFNFSWLFLISAKLSNFRLSNLKLPNFSFFPTALSNYTYPVI